MNIISSSFVKHITRQSTKGKKLVEDATKKLSQIEFSPYLNRGKNLTTNIFTKSEKAFEKAVEIEKKGGSLKDKILKGSSIIIFGFTITTLFDYCQNEKEYEEFPKHSSRNDDGWNKGNYDAERLTKKIGKASYRSIVCRCAKIRYTLNPYTAEKYKIEKQTVDYHCTKAVHKWKKCGEKVEEMIYDDKPVEVEQKIITSS
jgi:hypothetical protein